MNKPTKIRELLKFNKTECGHYLLGQRLDNNVACTAWIRIENGQTNSTGRYFDLLMMILEAKERGEQWAIDLLADFLVRGE